ncbi:MAG: serine/threonine-protein kinase [Verrucomicrobiota bacterium]
MDQSDSQEPFNSVPLPAEELLERALLSERSLGRELRPEDVQGQIPGFEFVELIGEGGMGVVFRANQKSLKRDVAIKILRSSADLDSRIVEATDRFRREAAIMARLDHPNILTIYDFGVTESGLFYLVMELVSGGDLSKQLLDQSLSPNQALKFAREVCSALEYAHGCGVIHRDLKPSNIMLTQDGRAKVSDFGLSKFIGDEAQSTITLEAATAGTPEYMAPEQKTSLGKVDERSDIYSLGVLIYEMLTGVRPVGSWKPPSKAGVAVSEQVDETVQKALAPLPGERFQTVAEIQERLCDQDERSGRLLPSLLLFAAFALFSGILISVFYKSNSKPNPAESYILGGGKSKSVSEFAEQIETGLGWIGEDFAFRIDTPLGDFNDLLPTSEVGFRPELIRVFPARDKQRSEDKAVVFSAWHRGPQDWRVALRSPHLVSAVLHPVMLADGWTLTDHCPSYANEHFAIWTKNHPNFRFSEAHIRSFEKPWSPTNRDVWSYGRGSHAVGSGMVFGLWAKRRTPYPYGKVHTGRRSLSQIVLIASDGLQIENSQLMHVEWTGNKKAPVFMMLKQFQDDPGFERKLIYGDSSDLADLFQQCVPLAEDGWRIYNVSLGETAETVKIFVIWERWKSKTSSAARLEK